MKTSLSKLIEALELEGCNCDLKTRKDGVEILIVKKEDYTIGVGLLVIEAGPHDMVFDVVMRNIERGLRKNEGPYRR